MQGLGDPAKKCDAAGIDMRCMRPDDLSARVSCAGTSLPSWYHPLTVCLRCLDAASISARPPAKRRCISMACSCRRVAYPTALSLGGQYLPDAKKPTFCCTPVLDHHAPGWAWGGVHEKMGSCVRWLSSAFAGSAAKPHCYMGL